MTMKESVNLFITDSWDTDSIVTLYRDAGWWRDEYNPDDIPRIIRSSSRFCVGVLNTTCETIATGRLISDQVSTGYIQDMCVLKKYRGLGVGRRLLQFLTHAAADAGLVNIILVAEPGTCPFYERSDFITNKNKIFLLFKERLTNENSGRRLSPD
jgi:GNAT superfamily N-acetyltransferase